ncbi:MAG TPA: phosphoglycerate kinase [Vicinamibacterales bacterium]|nr:phosphoglycerate kinase [Vicinamibacterales bacterium]
MTKYSIKDLNLAGKRVFIRVDFNVPIKNGTIGDDTRITSSLPTIRYALEKGATVILASHLGRPKGKPTPEFSLKPVADRLSQLLKRDVVFAADCIGEPARKAVADAQAGSKVVLLENLRFYSQEEQDDPDFAKSLAELADLYVNDAFGAAHRSHASVDGMVSFFSGPQDAESSGPRAAAGLLMEKELQYLGMALGDPERPFVAVIGGAKVSDKIEVIESMLGRVDRLLIGGAMAYTFFRALGMPVGKSLVEEDKQDAARSVIEHAKARGVVLQLPVDHVVADKIDAAAATQVLKVGDAAIGDRMGLDIGPESARLYAGLLADAKTVVWNGPMGVFEVAPFAKGTLAVANAVAAVTGTTIIGGGDSVAAINAAGVADKMTHISTGGGASLEFLGGAELPGVAALPDRA